MSEPDASLTRVYVAFSCVTGLSFGLWQESIGAGLWMVCACFWLMDAVDTIKKK